MKLSTYQILQIIKGFLILGMSISYYMAHKKNKKEIAKKLLTKSQKYDNIYLR